MPTAAQDLARFCSELDPGSIPVDVRRTASVHILDVLGCGMAALASGEVPWVLEAALEEANGGASSAIGHPLPLPVVTAAVVNGTLCHALDFDDTHPLSSVHASAPIVPAALATAESIDATGADTIAAIIAGYEVAARIGGAAAGAIHAAGFHPTGICGVFGAAAAASRLYRLDPEQTVNAFGIAGSMASGILEFLADGSEVKKLHAGWAAQSGVIAARLARHGATGPPTVLEGERGFYATYLGAASGQVDLGPLLSTLGNAWETREIAYKPYPSCHATHAPIDALKRLMVDEHLMLSDVESLVALTDINGESLVLLPTADKAAPRTSYEAKFSLPYCLARVLVDGDITIESFATSAIADPQVLDIAGRVTYEVRDYSGAADGISGGVVVMTKDGRQLEAELLHQRGGVRNPMSEAEIVEKYRSNAALGLPSEDAAQFEAGVLDLENLRDLSLLRTLRRVRAA